VVNALDCVENASSSTLGSSYGPDGSSEHAAVLVVGGLEERSFIKGHGDGNLSWEGYEIGGDGGFSLH